MLDPSDPRRLEMALQGSQLGLWDWDMVTGETIFNDRWAEIIGYDLAELTPTTIQTWIQYSHPDDLEASNKAIAAHIAGDTEFYDVDVRMKHRDGSWVWVHDRGHIVERSADGTPLRMVGTHEDITERVQREIALLEAQTVFDNSLEGIAFLDADEVFTLVNASFSTITGWPAEGTVGRPFGDVCSDVDAVSQVRRSLVLAEIEQGVRMQREFKRRDGSMVPVLMSVNRALDPSGETAGYVIQFSDLSEQVRAANDQIGRVLYIDDTTGLFNARGFRHNLKAMLQSNQGNNVQQGLIIVSLDNLGDVREAFGYEGAELVVSILANRLRDHLTQSTNLARFGRDDFAVLLADASDHAYVEETARKLVELVGDVCRVPGIGTVFVTASAGITLIPDGIESADHVIREATAATNLAQWSGPGSVRFHEEGLLSQTRERVILVTQIYEAWQKREFYLEYQPINDTQSGQLIGVEALMRWNSSRLGIVMPDEFIALAEESGLIVEMGSWAIAEAARQAAAFRKHGIAINMSVNVAVQQVTSSGFAEVVMNALAEAGLPGDQLILEVTESTLLHTNGATLELLAQLEAVGVRLALDDFGTGYSSFAFLYQYPLDRLKIDKSFIQGIVDRPSARAIVAAMIDLGHHLGLKVVAEGVETEQQLRVLRELKCDLFQGFLASPAVSPVGVMEMVSSS